MKLQMHSLHCFFFCNVSNIDLTKALLRKQEEIKLKYPIEKAKGKCLKYDKLEP